MVSVERVGRRAGIGSIRPAIQGGRSGLLVPFPLTEPGAQPFDDILEAVQPSEIVALARHAASRGERAAGTCDQEVGGARRGQPASCREPPPTTTALTCAGRAGRAPAGCWARARRTPPPPVFGTRTGVGSRSNAVRLAATCESASPAGSAHRQAVGAAGGEGDIAVEHTSPVVGARRVAVLQLAL